MGKTSVEVYVLQRRRLVQERKKRLIFLFKHMKIAKDLLEEMNSNAIDADVRLKFEEAIDILRYYTNKDQPYAGMCRYFVRRFMEENNLIN